MSSLSHLRQARATVRLAAALALKGGQRKLLTFVAPWGAPHCNSPVDVYRAVNRTFRVRSVEVSMTVPCRKCAKCLQFRQLRWRERALAEIARSNRTWMVTLTFSPVQLAGVLVSAGGTDLVAIERRAYADVQRFLKRLRKSGAVFRYLAVFERGEASGRAHYHLLIHETGRFPVPKRVIEETWPSHVHARLVDATQTGAASYTTKYLTKAIEIRPRASSKYGSYLPSSPPAAQAKNTPKNSRNT